MPPVWAKFSDQARRRLLAWSVAALTIVCAILIWITGGGCATFDRGGFRLSTHGIAEARVREWVSFVERKSGQKFGDFRLTVHANITGHEQWAPSLGRPVGVIRDGSKLDGAAATTQASHKSGLIRIALARDGFFPDFYGYHETAHALSAHLYGKGDLPPAWRSWVPYWHP